MKYEIWGKYQDDGWELIDEFSEEEDTPEDGETFEEYFQRMFAEYRLGFGSGWSWKTKTKKMK